MAEPFVKPVKVMFQHCDPAGIVFYPRYFEMINAVVEDWFEEAVGVSFAAMHGPRRMGVPAARVAVDFRAPSRLGEVLDFSLRVARLGGAALDLHLAAHGSERHGADGLRLRAALTLVHVDAERLKAAPWPADIRARIAPMLGEGAA